MHPKIQWSQNNDKILVTAHPAINNTSIVAQVSYDVKNGYVENIMIVDN